MSLLGPWKTSRKNFEKNQLERLLKDWPGGMSFVLEGVIPPSAPGEAGYQLLAIGYKYNSTKVHSFVCTKDTGPATNGIAYQAKWSSNAGLEDIDHAPGWVSEDFFQSFDYG